MRKLILLFLLSLLTAHFSFAQSDRKLQYNREECAQRKKEKQESKIILSYPYDDATGKFSEQADTVSITRYDKEGREISYAYIHSGKWNYSYTFYDASGLIRRILSCTRDSAIEAFINVYEYDSQQHLTCEKCMRRERKTDRIFMITSCTWNKDGCLVQESVQTDHDGQGMIPGQTTHYVCNEKSKPVLAYQVEENGIDTTGIDSLFYTADGLVSKMVRYGRMYLPYESKTPVKISFWQCTSVKEGKNTRMIFESALYDYAARKLGPVDSTVTISNASGQILEDYSPKGSRKLFYGKKKNFLYAIRYDKAGKPKEKTVGIINHYT